MLANVGSGASFIKILNKDDYIRVSGTSLGGAVFMGLSNLLI